MPATSLSSTDRVTVTDLVNTYEANPLVSKEIAARFDELRSNGDTPTRHDLANIITEETERSPAVQAQRQAQTRAIQQGHPLYNTLHRRDLLNYWENHGQPPEMPPHSLDQFTNWIARHSASNEEDVKDFAQELEKASFSVLLDRLGWYATRYNPDYLPKPTDQTQRNLRRTLRSCFRQYNEQAAHLLLKISSVREKYVSDLTLRARKSQLAAQLDWINATTAINQDGFSIPLSYCIRTPEARQSELYTLVKGQESYFTSQGYTPLFVTVTTPPRFHSAPTYGRSSWDGSTPTDSHDYLRKRWSRVRAKLAKKHKIRLDGFRVTEPHRDGSEHWHMMLYVKSEHMQIVIDAVDSKFKFSEFSTKYKFDFIQNKHNDEAEDEDEDEDEEGGKATAASYMLKYLIKTIGGKAAKNTSAANDSHFQDEADRADAWRSTWCIRGFQFFGILQGKITLWRELRRIEVQPEEADAKGLWRAARGGRAHHFIAKLKEINGKTQPFSEPPLATLREIVETVSDPDPDTGEITKDRKIGRITGLQINGIQYITHESKWELETDYKMLKSGGDTVIHKYPSPGTASDQNPHPHLHPPPNFCESAA